MGYASAKMAANETIWMRKHNVDVAAKQQDNTVTAHRVRIHFSPWLHQFQQASLNV
jgi:hypothetical protein